MTVYNDQVSQYINDLFVPQDPVLQYIQENTLRLGLPAISVKPEEGRFLQFLVRATAARRVVEFGALGGYSGTWIARGLVPGGRLFTIEKKPLHAEVAAEHFRRAGVDDRIEVWVGEARQLFPKLSAQGPYDFVFIDADKDAYPKYLDWALENTRPGGVIAVHNAFRKGSVAGIRPGDQFTGIMQEFNRRFASEPGLLATTVFPAGDGMLLGVKAGQRTEEEG